MNTKMLLVFAHPDDESFSVGGTVAKYAAMGWTIDLVCATRGQAGEYGPYEQNIDLAAIRSEELEAAAKELGINSVQFLDYPDGKLSKINPGELEDKIHKILLALSPSVVVTFEANGVSNHPDHRKISLSTTYAFQKYAKLAVRGEKLGTRDPRRQFTKVLPPSSEEPKLYYTCMPASIAEFLKKQKVIPAESYDKPWTGVADKMITTIIDIKDFTEKKITALSKHKTQQADVQKFVSIDNQPLAYTEYFVLRMQGEQEVFMGNNDIVAEEL